MALFLGMIVLAAVMVVAQWVWSYQYRQFRHLEAKGPAKGPAKLLRRLEVRITAVLVHDRSIIVGMRDEHDDQSLHTLVVGVGPDRDQVVATLEEWCSDGARLQLDRVTSGRSVELHHLDDSRTLALRLAA